MGQTQKIITTALWALVVAVMTGIVVTGMWTRGHAQGAAAGGAAAQVASGESDAVLPTYFPAPAFSLIDQDNKPFESGTLSGHVNICSFIFTHCPDSCPMMTSHMAEIQRELSGQDVRFVSFSVDPMRDTPEALKAYAKQYDADESTWAFLTGTKQQMAEVAFGYKLTAEPKPDGNVSHSLKFLLVDPAGKIRGIYGSETKDEMTKLVADTRKLIAGKS